MAWWHRDKLLGKEWPSRGSDTAISANKEIKPGDIIHCDYPKSYADALQKARSPVPTLNPEPDLSTKPKDVVGYCFGFVCPKKHVQQTFDTVTIDGYKERRTCQTCGGISKPAVVKRISEAQWGNRAHITTLYDRDPKPNWGWYNSNSSYIGLGLWAPHDAIWTKYEFVHYLESPKRRKK